MLNRKLEVLADENNYPFCSASSGLLTDNVLSKAYTNDGYLLNKEGRTVFAKSIASYLKSLIAFRQGVSLPVATSCNFTRDGLKNIVQKSTATVNIVMLGNSITNGGGDWNKKLNRNDVRNAGIGGYTTGQMLWHMDSSVVAAHPKMCFVMAGINDLGNQIPLDLIFRNQKMIIAKLLANNIKPVMQLTLYKAGNIEMNKNVDKINATLLEYCKAQNIDYIDLNPSLSDETGLKKEYTTDGTHLKEPAYAIWSKILMEYLEKNK